MSGSKVCVPAPAAVKCIGRPAAHPPCFCGLATTCRHFPVAKTAWQDVKGANVLVGSYDEAIKMMGDLNFLTALTAEIDGIEPCVSLLPIELLAHQ